MRTKTTKKKSEATSAYRVKSEKVSVGSKPGKSAAPSAPKLTTAEAYWLLAQLGGGE